MTFKTTDICDNHPEAVRVAEAIGLRDYGGVKSFHGTIQTVKCFEDNSIFRKTLEQNGTGKVLVVDGSGSQRCALMGDMMGELAVKNNWSGLIIHGCVRDSATLATLSVGVKAMNTTPMKSGKRNVGQENIPVHFAGVDFIPGQFVYCDEDGIVVSGENFAS
ncbi:MAG: ribonuclease E activity regulator RraA [Chloroflexi bacterium]|nr:ribonuclease E activity regulator RraA [Chloroflexota bacterium]